MLVRHIVQSGGGIVLRIDSRACKLKSVNKKRYNSLGYTSV